MNIIKEYLQKISLFGKKATPTQRIAKKVAAANQLTVISMACVLIGIICNTFIGPLLLNLLLAAWVFVCFISLMAAYYNRIYLSRMLFLFAAFGSIAAMTLLLNRQTLIGAYLFACIPLIFIFFDYKEKKQIIMSLLIGIGAFSFVFMTRHFTAWQQPQTEIYIQRLRTFTISLACLLTIAYIFYLVYENNRFQNRIEYEHQVATAIINVSSNVILLMDAQYRLLSFNAISASAFQKAWDIYIYKGMPLATAVANAGFTEEADIWKEMQQEAADGKTVCREMEVRKLRGTATLEIILSPCRLKNSSEMVIAAFVKDITQRKKKEVELKARNKEIEIGRQALVLQARALEVANVQLEKLNDEKNKLLGMAAHDLRNPAMNIITLVDIVLETNENIMEEESLIFLRMIRDTARHLSHIVHNMLDVSCIESGNIKIQKTATDLVALIRQNVKLNSFNARKKEIDITFTSNKPILIREVDPNLIEQALNNLISNAIKFSHSHNQIEVSLKQSQDKIIVAVKDQGQGIPAKELSKLFKFFSRTSVQSTNGEMTTGLGLAITKKIVEAHDGNVAVKSKSGVGSTFFIEI